MRHDGAEPDDSLATLAHGGHACGGRGGGTAANALLSSGTWPAAVHAAMPFFQTSVSRVRPPEATCDASAFRSNGPCCWPPTPTYHSAAGSGGGPAVGAGVFIACVARWPAAIPRPKPNASPAPPGL